MAGRNDLQIREDDLQGAAVVRLLREHLEDMHRITPPGSVHALDVEGLRSPDITFWSVWEGDALLGCGALKAVETHSGEVKSMRTETVHRGRGVASALLLHIISEARRRAYRQLYLETGAQPEFASARALYERHGFTYRGPFADYRDDPNSVFMVRAL